MSQRLAPCYSLSSRTASKAVKLHRQERPIPFGIIIPRGTANLGGNYSPLSKFLAKRVLLSHAYGAFIAHFEFLLTVYRTFRVSSFYGDRLVEMREEITSTSKKFEMKRRNVKCSGPSNRETLQMLKFDWNGHSVTTRYKRSSSSPCRVSH